MKALTFIAGAAVGYVLGTKAGRERYEQIVAGAKNLKEQPMVAQAQTRAKDLMDAGGRKVKTKFGGESTSESMPGELSTSGASSGSSASTRSTTSSGRTASSPM